MPLSIETNCLHLENEKDGDSVCSHYGAISFPIYQTATYAHPGVGRSTGFDYSRLQNPTREQLEMLICELEHPPYLSGFVPLTTEDRISSTDSVF